jgi:Winged helix DNA-binding domain
MTDPPDTTIGTSIARQRMPGLGLTRPGAATPEAVVARLTAMQSQEHPYARWSVAQRMRASPTAAVVDEAFDEGRILRTHVLRPTWHYVAATDLRWLMGLSGPRVDAGNARRHAELELDAPTLNQAMNGIARAVEAAPRTRRQLAEILAGHGISTAGQRLAYLLMHAELCRVVASGPMVGQQHTYAAFDQRVPTTDGPVGEEALATLAWRYFATRGPATLKDFVWWSGLPTANARRALEAVQPRLQTRKIEDREYWFAEEPKPAPRPRIDLVQCYDEAIISYSQTRDVLQTPALSFPVPRHLDGFIHVVLLDGKLLGHWRRRHTGHQTSVETRIGRSLEPKEQIALEREIKRYVTFSGTSHGSTARSGR